MNELAIYEGGQLALTPAYSGDLMPVIDCPFDNELDIVRWQSQELRTIPTVIKRHEVGFDYLDIGYVQDTADHIFGVGNWGVIPQGPLEKIESATAKGDPKVTLIDRVVVWVRFANGKVQAVDALGVGEFFPNNPRANFAASAGAARSEAIKSALKRLGNAFGRNIKEQAAEIRVNMAADDLDSLIASKSMIFWTREGEGDHLLTHEDIETVAQTLHNQPFTTLDPKKKGQVLEHLKDRTISVADYDAIKESVEAAGKTVKDGASVAELKRLEAEIRRRR